MKNRQGWTAPAAGRLLRTLAFSTASQRLQFTENLRTRSKQAIVVEGLADRRAVQRAVPDPVFVLGSSTWVEGVNAERVITSLQEGLPHFEKVITLLDPDVAGRHGRTKLEAALPQCLWHAFLPSHLATASASSRWHAAGNIGIEHASPASIRDALEGARLATPDRQEFSKQQLVDLGLTAVHGLPNGGIQVRRYRELVCGLLGIGDCDGKQLLKQLNLYGFSKAELHAATRHASKLLLSGRDVPPTIR